jgi:hypothetical protein
MIGSSSLRKDASNCINNSILSISFVLEVLDFKHTQITEYEVQ